MRENPAGIMLRSPPKRTASKEPGESSCRADWSIPAAGREALQAARGVLTSNVQSLRSVDSREDTRPNDI